MESLNGATELRLRRNLPWRNEKQRRIFECLSSNPVSLEKLRQLAVSHGGLVHSSIRRKAWTKLVGIDVFRLPQYDGPPLSQHKDRAQVLLDVNRCGKRIPSHFTEGQCEALKEQLTRVILRLLAENEELHYYQGLHDVALTLLLVTGEEIAFAIMSVITSYHIRDYLDKDMSRTKVIIGYLPPLLALEDAALEQFVTRSECAYYFSLSWLITWYGHVVKTQEQANRLMDLFLASHPLMAVYLAAAIILSRKSEILSLDCEMSAVHGLLSKLPDSINYEQLITMATALFEKHPPSQVARKGRLKMKNSSLISSYPQFLDMTSSQLPDHLLRHRAPPPKTHGWWHWITGHRTMLVTSLLSVATPVLLAVLFYWIYQFIPSKNQVLLYS